MNELKRELKELIVACLKLEGVAPTDISDHKPLFGDEGLGLDSIDSLELAVTIEQRYRVKIPNQQVGQKVFASINELSSFIDQNRQDR
jgi:acyl carrier protein